MLNIIFIIIGVIFNVICIWSIKVLLKDKGDTTWKSYLKYIIGIPVGSVLSLLLFPISISGVVLFAVMGGALGELLSLFFITVKQAYKKDTIIPYYDDGAPARFFITGDKHRRFDKVKEFCREMNTRRKDVLIILGDAGFNYYDDKRDDDLSSNIAETMAINGSS